MLRNYRGEDLKDLFFDFEIHRANLENWIAHKIRGFQQDLAKSLAFECMNENTIIWIKDWAQKILPTKYREAQSDYFAKKGLSAHVDVIFRKKNDQIEKFVFITLLESSDQGLVDTLCVTKHVLKRLKNDIPSVKMIIFRSDNASCYSGNGAFDCLYQLCRESDTQLIRIDFSEPQHGKDSCDREAATFKRYMRGYISAGNNVTSAIELKKAIMFNGGPKRTKVSIISVDKCSDF